MLEHACRVSLIMHARKNKTKNRETRRLAYICESLNGGLGLHPSRRNCRNGFIVCGRGMDSFLMSKIVPFPATLKLKSKVCFVTRCISDADVRNSQ
eukprot:SAG31_NODE_20654_length_568_cov_1.332623_2_plen_95_part_01